MALAALRMVGKNQLIFASRGGSTLAQTWCMKQQACSPIPVIELTPGLDAKVGLVIVDAQAGMAPPSKPHTRKQPCFLLTMPT